MKLIVLDRDGVINQDSEDSIKTPDEWQPIAGSLEAISRLNHSGYTVAIATNQPGLAKGHFDVEVLMNMHKKMDDMLARLGGRIDAVFYCPHEASDGCACRKPKPGMLLDIGQRFNVSLKDVTFIGDSISDINTAKHAHAKAMLVRTGKGVKAEKILQADSSTGKSSVPVYDDLASAVTAIIQ